MSLGEEYETYLLGAFSLDTSETKIAARYSTVADPVEGLGGGGGGGGGVWMTVRPPPPLPLSQGLDRALLQAFAFYDLSDKSRL